MKTNEELIETNKILLEALKSITQIKWRSTLAGLDRPTDFAEREAALRSFYNAVDIAERTINIVESKENKNRKQFE